MFHKIVEKLKDPIIRKKVLIGFSTFLFFFIILFSLTDPILKIPTEKKGLRADFEFKNVKITYFESGINNWEIRATKASIYKESQLTKMNSVNGIVYHNEKPTVLFDAPHADFNLESSNIDLKEAHATINNKRRKIVVFADTLSWFSDKKTFIGKQNASIKTRGIDLFGDYFKVDIPIKKLIISDQGKAVLKQDEN